MKDANQGEGAHLKWGVQRLPTQQIEPPKTCTLNTLPLIFNQSIKWNKETRPS